MTEYSYGILQTYLFLNLETELYLLYEETTYRCPNFNTNLPKIHLECISASDLYLLQNTLEMAFFH